MRYIESYEIPKDDFSHFHGKEVVVEGSICEDPDERIGNTKLTICAKEGKILLTTKLYPKYDYGDTLKISGKLEKPKNFDNFAYDKYLALYGIYSVMYYPNISVISHDNGSFFYAMTLDFKKFIQRQIQKNVPEPQASVMNAFFLGLRGGIPDDLNQAFKASGIIHLIAISGSHITLLMFMLESLLPFFYISRSKAFYIISSVMVFYIVLIGAPASAVRAGIMGAVILFAKKVGRLSNSLNILVFTAALMLLQNPKLLFDDIGFQLSFLALWGIIEFVPRWEEKFHNIPNFFGLKGIFFMTIASQIATFPILAYNFKTLSLISPVTNIFILPIFTFFMGVSSLSLGISIALEQFGIIAFFIPYILISYIMGASKFFSQTPFASVPLEKFSLEVLVVNFFLILYFTYWYSKKWKSQEGEGSARDFSFGFLKNIFMAVFGIFFLYIVFPYAYFENQKAPKVIFFNVGQGDSALIRGSGGKTALIDGGPDNTILYKLGKYYPWWKRDIDVIVVSHPHADHITGFIETISRFNVKKIITAGVEQKTFENKTLLQIAREKKIPMEIIDSKRKMEFDRDLVFDFFSPEKNMQNIILKDDEINDASIVFEVVYKKNFILFMGDAGVKTQKEIMNDLYPVQIIKIPHQGSAKSFYKEFFEKLKPEYSIISVGENNYGHPSLRVIRELERMGSKAYVTKNDGDIIIEFGEGGMSVAVSQ